jgi:hypothetical protein
MLLLQTQPGWRPLDKAGRDTKAKGFLWVLPKLLPENNGAN